MENWVWRKADFFARLPLGGDHDGYRRRIGAALIEGIGLGPGADTKIVPEAGGRAVKIDPARMIPRDVHRRYRGHLNELTGRGFESTLRPQGWEIGCDFLGTLPIRTTNSQSLYGVVEGFGLYAEEGRGFDPDPSVS